MKSNRFWYILLSAVMLMSAIAAFVLRRGPADQAFVYQDGVLIERLDLSAVAQPFSFTVGYETGENIILVETGRIRISEADCPDGSCVRQGWAGSGRTPLVCLPHRLVIQLDGAGELKVDAVAR